jgi:hypothetical protein
MNAVVSLLRSNGVSNRPVGDLTVASLGGRSRYRIDVSTVRKYRDLTVCYTPTHLTRSQKA